MKELRIYLNVTFFRLLKMGKRNEFYLDITPYWQSRICQNYHATKPECQTCRSNYCRPVLKYEHFHLSHGDPNETDKERHLHVSVKELRKSHGKFPFSTSCFKVFVIQIDNNK